MLSHKFPTYYDKSIDILDLGYALTRFIFKRTLAKNTIFIKHPTFSVPSSLTWKWFNPKIRLLTSQLNCWYLVRLKEKCN
jgi:hypothetical protein